MIVFFSLWGLYNQWRIRDLPGGMASARGASLNADLGAEPQRGEVTPGQSTANCELVLIRGMFTKRATNGYRTRPVYCASAKVILQTVNSKLQLVVRDINLSRPTVHVLYNATALRVMLPEAFLTLTVDHLTPRMWSVNLCPTMHRFCKFGEFLCLNIFTWYRINNVRTRSRAWTALSIRLIGCHHVSFDGKKKHYIPELQMREQLSHGQIPGAKFKLHLFD